MKKKFLILFVTAFVVMTFWMTLWELSIISKLGYYILNIGTLGGIFFAQILLEKTNQK